MSSSEKISVLASAVAAPMFRACGSPGSALSWIIVVLVQYGLVSIVF